ncbi:MAG: 30S ribosomal protein S17 [Candidatus Aenigmarchaeota archaeon]|nr:30S ribosomal protein S17 [Candidatus Aenigmarchaeota archaeon]
MKGNIGIEAAKPESECASKECPWHGSLSIRGRVFKGTVASAKSPKTVTVTWDYLNYVPKFERYARKRTKISAHNPECIGAKEGDIVVIAECRPISKTKNFVVVEKIVKGV